MFHQVTVKTSGFGGGGCRDHWMTMILASHSNHLKPYSAIEYPQDHTPRWAPRYPERPPSRVDISCSRRYCRSPRRRSSYRPDAS